MRRTIKRRSKCVDRLQVSEPPLVLARLGRIEVTQYVALALGEATTVSKQVRDGQCGGNIAFTAKLEALAKPVADRVVPAQLTGCDECCEAERNHGLAKAPNFEEGVTICWYVSALLLHTNGKRMRLSSRTDHSGQTRSQTVRQTPMGRTDPRLGCGARCHGAGKGGKCHHGAYAAPGSCARSPDYSYSYLLPQYMIICAMLCVYKDTRGHIIMFAFQIHSVSDILIQFI